MKISFQGLAMRALGLVCVHHRTRARVSIEWKFLNFLLKVEIAVDWKTVCTCVDVWTAGNKAIYRPTCSHVTRHGKILLRCSGFLWPFGILGNRNKFHLNIQTIAHYAPRPFGPGVSDSLACACDYSHKVCQCDKEFHLMRSCGVFFFVLI